MPASAHCPRRPHPPVASTKQFFKGGGWGEGREGRWVGGGVGEGERYAWDAAARTVAIETLDSNVWGPGSRWDYRLTPDSVGGTTIHVAVVRIGRSWKGRVIGLALALAGPGMLRSQMKHALAGIAP